MKKVHFALWYGDPDYEPAEFGDGMFAFPCQRVPPPRWWSGTKDSTKVTCKACLRYIPKLAKDRLNGSV